MIDDIQIMSLSFVLRLYSCMYMMYWCGMIKEWISFFWCLSKYKLHWAASKVYMNPDKHQKKKKKKKFIAYTCTYIHFYPEYDEESVIRLKSWKKTTKHLHAVLVLTTEQCHWPHDVADVQSDCRGPWFILTSLKVMWRHVTRCHYWNGNYITFHWVYSV